MRTISLALLLICFATTPAPAQQAGQTPSLRILSSNGPRAPIEDIQAEIEAALGYSLDIEFSTAASLTDRIEAGESFDVAILTPALIERLVAGGYVSAEPVTVFARSGVGVGAASGGIERDVGTVDALRATLLAAESITLTANGQSRRVSEAAFEALGIVEQLAQKIVLVGPGEGPHIVADGGAELVLTLISEIVPVAGLELVGPFPAELQEYVSFAAGINPTSTEPDAARRLLEQLISPASIRALEPHGMEALTR